MKHFLNRTSSFQFCSDKDKLHTFVSDIQSNTRRYISLFAEAADDLMPARSYVAVEEDSFDILMRQVRRDSTSNCFSTIMQHRNYNIFLTGYVFVDSSARASRGKRR